MDFVDLVKVRQSDRGYTPQIVGKDDLLKCLEAGRLAPSACNSQPWKFVVVDESELKVKLAAAVSSKIGGLNSFASSAQIFIVLVSQKPKLTAKIGGLLKSKDYSTYDHGIAAEHICLQATELGLGSCILGWFDEKAIKNLLTIPRGNRIELVITLGYPAKKETRIKSRKSLEEIVSFNEY